LAMASSVVTPGNALLLCDMRRTLINLPRTPFLTFALFFFTC